ncbi:hypothetical protein [Methanomethylophilus alvi]|uniref:hypothetical protein n=1 Tax=Methanomethylophilus alvi TaxID=1291540 RepID=UPI0037DC8826
MIKYSYSFNRDEGDQIVSYGPNYSTEFFNIANLKGDSSTGKSTLMNLIAMAFYGSDDPRLPLGLRKKVEHLFNNEKIDLDFEVELTSVSGRVLKSHVVKTRNKSGKATTADMNVVEIDESGHEHKLFKEKFRQNYRLIYDIPDNPTKRLDHSIDEILKAQNAYLENATSLLRTVRETSDSIRKSRDQNEINEINNKIENLSSTLSARSDEYDGCKSHLDLLYKYYWAKRIQKHVSQIDVLDKKIKDTTKECRRIKKSNKAAQTKYNTALENYNILFSNFKNAYRESIASIEKIEACDDIDVINLQVWRGFDTSIKKDICPSMVPEKIPGDFLSAAETLKDLFSVARNKYYSKEDVDKYELLGQFLDILESYSKCHENIKILDRPTDALYDDFKAEYDRIKSKVAIYKDYGNAVDSIQKCISIGESLCKAYSDLPQKPIEQSVDDSDEDLKKNRNDAFESMQRDLKESAKYGVYSDNFEYIINSIQTQPSSQDFKSQNLIELYSTIESNENKLSKLKQDIEGEDGLKNKIAYLKNHLEELEGCEIHPLYCCKDLVEKISSSLTNIQKDLHKKNGILQRFINKDKDLVNVKLGGEDEEYLKLVWKNLGKRFEKIRFVGVEYEISEVNLLKSEMITKTGKIISLNDMGTGESQSAYLMNVLRSNEDSCIIAMFDESENMDSELRLGIQREFKKLYDSNHLILGLIASHGARGEDPIVEEFNDA